MEYIHVRLWEGDGKEANVKKQFTHKSVCKDVQSPFSSFFFHISLSLQKGLPTIMVDTNLS